MKGIKIRFDDKRCLIGYDLESISVRHYRSNKDYASIDDKLKAVLETDPEYLIIASGISVPNTVSEIISDSIFAKLRKFFNGETK
jgi:hypothetical protein